MPNRTNAKHAGALALVPIQDFVRPGDGIAEFSGRDFGA
jgi:hypothetical protein